jgi:SulP family sulfate permease
MKKFFPFLEWISSYNISFFKSDLSAGLTVGIMLIPQGMAYAMIAGLPPIYGLYAATIPLIVYALLGTSRQLAVGPVAMVSLLTAAGVGGIASVGSGDYITLAIVLAFMVGIIQFMMGVLRLGFLVNFLSHPVLSGFTSAAAIIIGFSQLKHLLGIDIPRMEHVHETIYYAIQHINETQFLSLLIGGLGIGIILLFRKIHKSIPSQIIVVILGILAVYLFGLADQGLKIVGSVPKGLPPLSIGDIDFSHFRALIPVAVAIALIGFMESIAVAKTIQVKHGDYELNSNNELIALGASNIIGSFFSSYPVTGGFSRTAVNDQAGARTGLASIISALLVLLTLLFLTSLFYNLPKAILASIIMVAVSGLVDIEEAKKLWKIDRRDFFLLVVTFLSTLILGIELGIGVGVLLSILVVMFKSTRPHIAVLGNIKGSPYYRNIKRFNLETDDDILIVRFDGNLFFANINYFQEKLEKLVIEKGSLLKLIVINAESIDDIDSTSLHSLVVLINQYQKRGIKVVLTGVIGPVRDAMERAGLFNELGENHFFVSVQEGIDSYRNIQSNNPKDSFESFSLQSNT